MSEARVFAVSELTDLVKNDLESNFSFLVVEGEISNWRPAPSGHVYFTLKDKGAMLQAVMFKGKAMRLSFRPNDGMVVRASGGLTVYAARGQYQLVVDSMQMAGAGDILAMLDERKRRLAAEGLFDQDRKKSIPAFPSRVAVITSPTGAAIRDILNVLARRNAGLRVTVLPSLVQGDEAPASLVRQLETANAWNLGDVIILGRGGGSLEDLLAFSDEAVVRAVASSRIPVISAVGHETDWSLCDLAADMRAPTPSAAAELVSESAAAVRDRVAEAAFALESSIRGKLDRARLALKAFSPDNLEMRLERALFPSRQRFDDAKEVLIRGMKDAALGSRHRMSRALAVLGAADPNAVLARGFSVIRKSGSTKAIRDSADISSGDMLDIRFAAGGAKAITTEVLP
ncbi:MAG: exodeoxyribonuclease VII large subunit [Spirochaetales bacterium]|nr:MAG: exodeoxyribonuclease VII large subunit [Spirochaetales bacterium]